MKNLRSLFISAILLTTACLSADDSKPPHVLRLSSTLSTLMAHEKKIIFSSDAAQLLSLAQFAFDKAIELDPKIGLYKTKNSSLSEIFRIQKSLFGDAIQLMDYYLSLTSNKKSYATTILSVSLYRHGCNLRNLGELSYLAKNYSLTTNLLEQAITSLTRSRIFFEHDSDTANIKLSNEMLALAFNLQGIALIKDEDIGKTHLESIDLFNKGIKALHASYNLSLENNVKEELSGTICLAVRKALEIFSTTHSEFSTETAPEIIQLLANLSELISLCQSIPLTQPIIEIVTIPAQKSQRSGHRQKRPQITQSSKFIDLEEFKRMIISRQCGLLQRLNRTDEATKLYTISLYNHKFEQGSPQQQEFIAANLDYLAGNQKPLIQFYKKLRQEKMIQRIKANQAKISQAPQEEPKKNHPKPIPSTPYASPSYSQENFQNSTPSSVTPTPPKPVKIKTRGTPSLPMGESVNIGTPPSGITDDLEPTILTLNASAYATFDNIVSDPIAKKISLPDVIGLLKILGCTHSKESGKGVHQKITAPNGQIWIAPQDWGNRIPDYYKLQLASFIQDALGIDPEFVHQK